MKKHITPFLFPFMAVLLGLSVSCTDENPIERRPVAVDDTFLVETRLLFDVATMNTATTGTRAADDDELAETTDEKRQDTKAERKIDNIWVLQFDAITEKLLITPRYYDVSDKNLDNDVIEADVLLKPDVESTIYVVANTGNAEWATTANSATLSDIKKLTLPNPSYIEVGIGETPDNLSIPMEGCTENVIPQNNEIIRVTVTRMYAKVEILIEDIPETINITDVAVTHIPFYSRVATIATESLETAATYPDETTWSTYAFNPGVKNDEGRYTGKMVIYLPENLQGRTDINEANPELKTNNAPSNALRIDFMADYVDIFTHEVKESGRDYAVYPGGNNYNDYNIRRNYIYRVKLNIYTDIYDQMSPSSNCFVVKPGQLLSFLPYYRTEEGGGYKFSDYLDSYGDDLTKRINNSTKMTENVRIIWQTLNAIGDNSNGDKVWIDPAPASDNPNRGEEEFQRKIYVKTAQRGNALIAAYNNEGEIVWSWHIWITENNPGNVSSAVVYSSYAWNERQIFTDIRVPGYALMPCNLGALKYYPDNVDKLDPDTHGMLYQWGRKDPFPPANTTEANDKDYNDTYTGKHYDNDNATVVGKTAGTDESKLFHSLAGKDIASAIDGDAIGYTVKHPTVFICGTKEAMQIPAQGEGYFNNLNNYPYEGDWMPEHDNKLWGGLEPDDSGDMKSYIIRGASSAAHIFDNYGNQKSIFDPCPSGWRVPPGDLWLGFTRYGINPKSYDEINTATQYKKGGGAGMYMYMTDWQRGQTSFFPTQGTRVPDGMILRTGSCGNYHNATTDINNRVNILHVHRDATLFNVFEFTFRMYHVKTTGGPIRCVRDHK